MSTLHHPQHEVREAQKVKTPTCKVCSVYSYAFLDEFERRCVNTFFKLQ